MLKRVLFVVYLFCLKIVNAVKWLIHDIRTSRDHWSIDI